MDNSSGLKNRNYYNTLNYRGVVLGIVKRTYPEMLKATIYDNRRKEAGALLVDSFCNKYVDNLKICWFWTLSSWMTWFVLVDWNTLYHMIWPLISSIILNILPLISIPLSRNIFQFMIGTMVSSYIWPNYRFCNRTANI